MKKKLLFLLVCPVSFLFGQADSTNILKNFTKNTEVNILFRSALEFTDVHQNQDALRLNEARMEVQGNVVENLKYRVRYRLNRTQAQLSLDNAPSSLDIAYIDYKFGKTNKWNIVLGKQANDFGSWEFENNPTFEYVYSDYINRQQNIFTMGAKLAYQIDENNSIRVQAFNTSNHNFSTLHKQRAYITNGLEAAKIPLGFNLTWRGDFFNKTFKTFYSVATSQIAKGEQNFQVALGNKLVTDNLEVYLDLHHTNMAVDYTNIASSVINQYRGAIVSDYEPYFSKNIQFQTAVLRLDYKITPKFIITGKSIYERANDRSENGLGNGLRQNQTNMIGLEYKPIASQDFKFFGYFSNTNITHNKMVKTYVPNTSQSMFSVGVLYFLKAL
ncbi:hypothetical protein CYV15_06280 [Riemerella anatipestifer]|uniref:porin n=1 Tax=Riemerella anatipestifer TaxID=34085 RepID=UPI000D142A7F|nr:porin [Riemerella anatipestifer]PST44220.1 hypothetical protein CYV15_06280 [Riemerella anatipestifer]